MNTSISRNRYLQALIFAGMMAPAVLLTAFRYFELNGELTASALSRRQSVADLSAAILSEKFSHIKDLAVSFSTRMRFKELVDRGDWDGAVRVFSDIPGNKFPWIDRIFLTDPDGRLMSDLPPDPDVRGKSFSHRDWYRSLTGTWEPCISEIYRRAAAPRYNVVAIAAPIFSPDGTRVSGIFVMQVRLRTILEWIRSIDAGLSGSVYFADKNGHAAGWWPGILDEKDVPDHSDELPVQEALAGNRGVRVVKSSSGGADQLAAYSPVGPDRWAAVLTQPVSEAFGMKRRIIRSFWSYSVLIMLLNALLAVAILKLQSNLLKNQRDKALADAERQQLELFAFVASHDLQEPLNKIMSFGSLLNETARSGMDDASRRSLDRMLAAAHRMSRMIEDVREFSAIRERGPRERVDLGQAVRQVIAELEEVPGSPRADFELGALPAIEGNASQIKLLFRNLIGNAIKYRHKLVPLKIEIGQEKADAGWVRIHVVDNGIGFDEKYAGQIFAPFKRLHSHAEYEGTGLGLAICQRIVSLHGGKIEARSRDNGGAVFLVTLPR